MTLKYIDDIFQRLFFISSFSLSVNLIFLHLRDWGDHLIFRRTEGVISRN